MFWHIVTLRVHNLISRAKNSYKGDCVLRRTILQMAGHVSRTMVISFSSQTSGWPDSVPELSFYKEELIKL